MAPFNINGEDFSQFPETGKLEQFDDHLNKRIKMGLVLKYPKLEKLEDMIKENHITLRNMLKSFQQRYYFVPNIDLIS